MKNEKGFVLVTGLLVVFLLTVLSLIATQMLTVELKVSGHEKSVKQAFYLAESGLEEARGRFHQNSNARIIDDKETSPNWKVFIGSVDKTQSLGFNNGNQNYLRVDNLTNLNYAVRVEHKVNEANQILRYGDGNLDGIPDENTTSGKPIYIVTSHSDVDNVSRTNRIEMSIVPNITTLSALYTKDRVILNGKSTLITGIDKCGGSNVPGILSYRSTIDVGQAIVEGNPPIIPDDLTNNMDVTRMVSFHGVRANYHYTYSVDKVDTGMNWGNPSLINPQAPSTCGSKNVVYYNMGGKKIKLTGGTTGCGVLLVNGDLEINGGFTWYGVVIVTGNITFLGGGERNITGAVISGGTSEVQDDVLGGDTALIYCSSAINFQTEDLPLKILRWTEVF